MTPRRANARGFSLIELLISMSIFAIITGFVAANYRVGRRADELRQGSQLLAANLRRVQTMALAGQSVQFCTKPGTCASASDCGSGATCVQGACVSATAGSCAGGATCGSGYSCTAIFPNGYGIRVSSAAAQSNRAVVFADLDGDRAYDTGEAIRSDIISAGPSVKVASVSPASSGTLDIVIEPPKPTVWFNGSASTAIASVTVRHDVTGSTRQVTINRVTGQVSAD